MEGPATTHPGDSARTQKKVQAALQLFASLKESHALPPPPPPPLPSHQRNPPPPPPPPPRQTAALRKQSDRDAEAAMALYEAAQPPHGGEASSGSRLYFFGTSSEQELKSMSSRELIRKLATSEAIMKRLHEKNKTVTRELAAARATGGGPVNAPRGASVLDAEVERLQRLLSERQQQHETALEEKERHIQQQHEKQMRLSALLGELEEKLQALQAMEQQPQPPPPPPPLDPNEKRETSETTAAEEVRRLTAQLHRLEVEKELLSGHLFEAEKQNRHVEAQRKDLEEQLRRLRSAEGVGSEEAQEHPSVSPPRRFRDHADDATPGSLSQYYSVLQDAITALQFRLHQSQAEKQQLQHVQLQALLESPSTPLPKINAEVKKLFSVMKRVMLSEKIEHEAQRQRMNEVLYVLEKEVASVGL